MKNTTKATYKIAYRIIMARLDTPRGHNEYT